MRYVVLRSWFALLFATIALTVPVAAPAVDMLTQHNDINRTGANITETVLTQANVNQNQFGRVFRMQVNGQVYAQPLYVSNLDLSVIGKGTHDVVIIATENNYVYCFDATNPGSGNGTEYWSRSLGTAADKGNGGCDDLTPRVGITSTPVIDKAAGTIYLISKTNTAGTYANKLHALNLATGADKPNSPQTVAGTFPKVGGGTIAFDPVKHFNRPGLLLNNGRVYAGFSSHCDQGPYQGWVFGWSISNLAATPSVYCTSPNGGQGGIWQSGRGLVGDASGNVYCATGNGALDGNIPGDKGMALLKLSSTLTLQSFFISGNGVNESNVDDDFASGGPLLVPGTTRLVMAGKTGIVFTCDTGSLGGYTNGANNCIQAITGANSLTAGGDGNAQAPVYWVGPSGPTVYYWGGRNAGNFPRAYRWNTGTNQLDAAPVSTGTIIQGGRAGGISLSANGSAAGTGILWSIKSDSGGNSPPGAGRLIALNAEDLTVTLWDSQQNAARDSLGNYSKLSYPTIANGRVYVPTLNADNATNYVAVYGQLTSTQPLRLAFTTQPATTAPGDLIPTFRVSVLDGNDQVVNTATNAITISLGNNPGPATLSGTLTVNAVNGVATFANVTISNNIANGYTLIASSKFTYTSDNIGGPGQAGSTTAVAGGYDLVGGGGDIYDNSDQFRFMHRTVTGDFDVRVRVASVTDTNLYTKSGLMAREGIAAGARNAMAIVFPKNATRGVNNGGYEYQFRNTTNNGTTAVHPTDIAGAGHSGWYLPGTGKDVLVQPPNSWIRLARTGTVLRAYFSYDGYTWTQYTTSDATGWPAALEVGLAECAHDNNTSATAQYRNLSYNGVADLGSVTSTAFDVQTGTVATPVIMPRTGTYTGPVKVAITTTTINTSIRYTTDGSTPTITSPLYSGTFTVSQPGGTVKAIGFRTGYTQSAIATAVYTISGTTPYGMATRGTLPTLTIPAAGATTGTLSGTGLFSNTATQTVSSGVVPYTVTSQLWSDAASKLRWVAIPNGELAASKITFQPTGEFAYPNGTVFVKHFALGGKRLETRLLVVNATGPNNGYGLTYKWRADNSDADLIATAGLDEVQTNGQTWHYPSRTECLTCHLTNAGFVLGPKAAQLNARYSYPGGHTDNQLRTWNYLAMFTADIDETTIPALSHTVSISDTTANLETRVKSYIEANCAFCHRPGGASTAFVDGRFATPLASMGLINVAPNKGNFGITGAMVVLPFDVPRSILSYRIHSTSATPNEKMPPLARNLVDTNAAAVIDKWIGNGAVDQAGKAPSSDDKKNCGMGNFAAFFILILGAFATRLWLVKRNHRSSTH